MIESCLIIFFSLILLAYWFRYSCLLLLRNESELANAASSAPAARFSFDEVEQRLKTEQALDPLLRSLRRDYEVMTYLVEHASGLRLQSIEERLLVLDYKLMRMWYWLTRALFPSQARYALAEMASVLRFLARRMGEQAALRSHA